MSPGAQTLEAAGCMTALTLLLSLQDRAAELRGAKLGVTERLAEAVEALHYAERAIRHQEQAPQGRVNHDAIARLKADLPAKRAERDRLRALDESLGARWGEAKALPARLAEALAGVPAEAIREAPPIRIPKGATIDGLRKQIADLAAEAEAVQSAPAPRSDAAKRIAAAVEALAARGARPVDARRRSGDPARIADALHGDSGLHFLVWAFREEIAAKLIAELPKDGPTVLTDRQQQRLAELAEERLRLERVEEALVEAAEAEGRTIARRPDASPWAILGVEVEGRPG